MISIPVNSKNIFVLRYAFNLSDLKFSANYTGRKPVNYVDFKTTIEDEKNTERRKANNL